MAIPSLMNNFYKSYWVHSFKTGQENTVRNKSSLEEKTECSFFKKVKLIDSNTQVVLGAEKGILPTSLMSWPVIFSPNFPVIDLHAGTDHYVESA
ncbi:MAG: hypothetical protein ACYCQJ_06470 [Nitrososphaerales archaeon]